MSENGICKVTGFMSSMKKKLCHKRAPKNFLLVYKTAQYIYILVAVQSVEVIGLWQCMVTSIRLARFGQQLGI